MASNTYQFAANWNNAGSLQNIPTQPTAPCPGILYAQVVDTISGMCIFNASYSELNYETRLPYTLFTANNAFFGFAPLSGITSVKGTFRIRIDDNTFANFNGVIKYPRNRKRVLASWAQIVYEIVNLVAI